MYFDRRRNSKACCSNATRHGHCSDTKRRISNTIPDSIPCSYITANFITNTSNYFYFGARCLANFACNPYGSQHENVPGI